MYMCTLHLKHAKVILISLCALSQHWGVTHLIIVQNGWKYEPRGGMKYAYGYSMHMGTFLILNMSSYLFWVLW